MKMQKMKLKLTLYAIAFLALSTNIQTFAQTQTDVDAVTGATLTTDGVSLMLQDCLNKYLEFLKDK